MNTTDRSRVIPLAKAQLGIPGAAGEHSVGVLHHGTLDVKLSFPERPNQQTPDAQDAVYVITRGRGVFLHDGERDPFESGDLVRGCGNRASFRRLYRRLRRMEDSLRPSGRRGPSIGIVMRAAPHFAPRGPLLGVKQ